jgi:N-acetylglucosamine-6-phosphate deacetylase
VIVSAGHTDATYEEARVGIDAGIRVANHTYNAMRGLHHRDPGALAALILDDRVTCELIADGQHVHPAAIRVLLRLVGTERICLVSDATAPAGLPPGTYRFLGRQVRISQDGTCRFPDGRLAGSARFLLHGVRTLVERAGLPVASGVRMASAVPATVLRLAGTKGSLAPGMDADLVVVSAQWRVLWTLVEGRIAHSPERRDERTNRAGEGRGGR